MRKIGLIVLTALTGCTFGPQMPRQGALPLPSAYSETTGSLARPGVAEQPWWRGLQDPTLDQILEAGFGGNLDIQQAQARLAAAEAAITSAGATGFPALTLGAASTATREIGKMKQKQGTVSTTGYQLSASWLIDLFGEVRSQIDSAEAARDAAKAGTEVARLALTSALATQYVEARFQQELAAITARTVASRRRTLALTQGLQREGVSSGLDVSRTEEAVRAVEAEQPLQEASFRRAAHRIATLLGQPAASLVPMLDKPASQPEPAWSADAGVPADLLRNRPDIRRAEMEYLGGLADIGFAWSQLFPSVTLSGSIAPSYVKTNAASGNLTTWSFGPQLKLPIFDGGRLYANVKVAVARAQEKEAAWRASVLTAVEEVENALVSYHREATTLARTQARVRAAQRSADLSRSAFREGLSSVFEMLDAERQLFEAQSAQARSRRNLALQYIALNVAVGRGLPGPGSASPTAR
jgi:multidrug efflux system outer membrane protein